MWFSKSFIKQNSDGERVTAADKIARKVAGYIYTVQHGFATKLNKPVNNMTIKKLKRLVVLFTVVCGGYSIYLTMNAITWRTQPQIKPQQINRPGHYDKTGDEGLVCENYVDEETFRQIQSFKVYMDSLKRTNGRMHDSIIASRPLLMDSVAMLEQIYYSQKSK